MSDPLDIPDLKRRMQGSVQALKHELGGLRTGRASASLVEPVEVVAYGQRMPLNTVATISVPESRMLSVQVWDKSMVSAVEKAIRDSNLGLSPTIEGQVLRIRIPELNEQRRKEMVKIAHRYTEEAKGRRPPRPPRRHRYAEEAAEGQGHQRGRPEAAGGRRAEGDRSFHRRDRPDAGAQGNRDHAGLETMMDVRERAAIAHLIAREASRRTAPEERRRCNLEGRCLV